MVGRGQEVNHTFGYITTVPKPCPVAHRSSILQFFRFSNPHFLRSSIPQILSPSIPQILNPQGPNSSNPQFLMSSGL